MMSAGHRVANKKDIKEGELLKVEPEGKPIVLAMVRGKIYALDATCTHEGGPLDEGKLEGYDVTCPWHYAVYDIRNGKVSDRTMWATSLSSYPVHVDEKTGDIFLALSRGRTEETVQQKKTEESEAQALEKERKFYEEEERKSPSKLTLRLLAKEKLEGTDIMTFKLERGGLDYAAGQFAYFKLEGVEGDPKGPVRHFTIASSPSERGYILISTRIRDTPYKQDLASLAVNFEITAWGPQGEFILQEDTPAVFLSGGIGVTPFRSMLKNATDRGLPTKIVVFDSNRNVENILYKNEFDRWARENSNIRLVYTLSDQKPAGWQGESGRIDKKMLTKHLSEEDISKSKYYVCGPPGMLKAMQALLKDDMKIPKNRIMVEEFTGY